MLGKIFVEASDVTFLGLPLFAKHLYLVYEADTGEEYTLRAGPDGRLAVFGGDFEILDNVPLPDSPDDRDLDERDDRHSTALDFDGLTDDQAWALMVKYARAFEASDPAYFLTGVNSNAFVGAMLAAAGADPDEMLPDGVSSGDAVGYGSYTEILDDASPPADWRILGTGAGEAFTGEAHGEEFLTGGGSDVVFAGGGADLIKGQGGEDRLFGQGGSDIIHGGGSGDEIHGDDPDVDIPPLAGQIDRLYGNSGDDTITGGAGANKILGGSGDDVINAGEGTIIALRGGGDDDSIDLGGAVGPAYGNAGDDFIFGGGSGSKLFGGGGMDVLLAGPGNFRLSGGADGDEFVFEGGGARNTVITDFEDGVDTIRIVDGGVDDFAQLSISTFGSADQHTRIAFADTGIELRNVDIGLIGPDDVAIETGFPVLV